jgi:hypothetical protein
MLKLVIARYKDGTGEFDGVLLESDEIVKVLQEEMQGRRYHRKDKAADHAVLIVNSLGNSLKADTSSLP